MYKSINNLIILSFLLIPTLSESTIRACDVAGFSELTKSEYKHLSPYQGLLALDSKLLRNIRFEGYYGTQNGNFPQHPQLNDENHKSDHPHDAVTTLIQWLFPSPAGGNLIPNQTRSLEGELKMDTIGAIIGYITHHRHDDNPSALATLIFKTQYPQDYQKLYTKLTQKAVNESLNQAPEFKILQQKQRDLTKALKSDPKNPLLRAQAQKLKADILTLKGEIQGALNQDLSKKLDIENLKQPPKRYQNAYDFAQKINAAVIQSDLRNDYPAHVVEWAFLGYACIKASEKKQMLDLVYAMGPEISNVTQEQDHFVTPKKWDKIYTKSDYKDMTKPLKSSRSSETHTHARKPVKESESMDYQLNQYLDKMDDLAFITLGYNFYEADLQLMHQQQSLFAGQDEYSYPDCGEMFIFNVLNLLLYQRKGHYFDVDFLTQSAPHVDHHLVDFYTKASPENMMKKRNEFSSLIANRTPKAGTINYRKSCPQGQYEIDAGLINALTVVADLLNDQDMKQVFQQQIPDTEKSQLLLDRLFNMFSTPEKSYDWHIKDAPHDKKKTIQNNEQVDIIVTCQRNYFCTFQISTNHFDVKKDGAQSDNWQHKKVDSFYTRLSADGHDLLLPYFRSVKKHTALNPGQKSVLLHANLGQHLDSLLTLIKQLYPHEMGGYVGKLITRQIDNYYDLTDQHINLSVLNFLCSYIDAGNFSRDIEGLYEKALAIFFEDLPENLNTIIWDSPSPNLIRHLMTSLKREDVQVILDTVKKDNLVSEIELYEEAKNFRAIVALVASTPTDLIPSLLENAPVLDLMVRAQSDVKPKHINQLMDSVPKEHHHLLFSLGSQNTLSHMLTTPYYGNTLLAFMKKASDDLKRMLLLDNNKPVDLRSSEHHPFALVFSQGCMFYGLETLIHYTPGNVLNTIFNTENESAWLTIIDLAKGEGYRAIKSVLNELREKETDENLESYYYISRFLRPDKNGNSLLHHMAENDVGAWICDISDSLSKTEFYAAKNNAGETPLMIAKRKHQHRQSETYRFLWQEMKEAKRLEREQTKSGRKTSVEERKPTSL